jgi:hypothetical protein
MIPVKSPAFKSSGHNHGRKRTQRHMRQKYGTLTPLPKVSIKTYIISVGSFAVFGLILLGTLYWLFE